MDKKDIEVEGFIVTQLSETEYEAENKFQRLDFHFDTAHPDAVEVFVFDSELETQGTQDSCVTTFYAANLEEAVIKAMNLEHGELSNATPANREDIVDKLRAISNALDSEKDAEAKTLLFPGWDIDFEEAPEPLIKEAASAILAADISPDAGTYISPKAVAALLHYIADMMEE